MRVTHRFVAFACIDFDGQAAALTRDLRSIVCDDANVPWP